jgi:hypothetical protein
MQMPIDFDLRLQAHAWILTGGGKPLVDFRKYYYADAN